MESSRAELQEKIKAQGDIVRKLKAEKAEKNLVRIIRFDAIGIYISSSDVSRWFWQMLELSKK